MLRAQIRGGLSKSIKTVLAAGVFFLGYLGSGAQAAFVTFNDDLAGWTAFAGGPILLEDFTDATLIPELSITPGNALPGTIGTVDGVYRDKADSGQATQPLLMFSGLGVTAFGAEWTFNPGPTDLRLTFTFADPSLSVVVAYGSSVTGQFFGFVSDVPILSILIDEASAGGADQSFDMDNARLVSAVPIPAALPLFLSAIVALGFLGRRRKRLATA